MRDVLTSLAAFALFAFPGCSSSSPESGGEDGRRSDPTRDEPQFEGAEGRADRANGREALLARFFAQRGISLVAAPECAWTPIDGEAALVLTIRNGGGRRLTLLGERKVGVWPFRHVERMRASLHLGVTQASLAGGVQHGEDTRFDDTLGTIVVEAGGERSLRLPIPLAFVRDSPRGVTTTLAASVTVRAELHPLAVQIEGEPERVCALPFDEVVLRYGPARVTAVGAADRAALEIGLADDPELLVAAALHAAEDDAAGVVARIVGTLPGPDAKARRARFIALEWITGRRFGDDVERWRGWWDSEEGMRFGHRGGGGR